jgi:hypothetical protein
MKNKDKGKEEKIIMEVTKGEAVSILDERLEDKWWVTLEPLLILAPGMFLAYAVYEILSQRFNEWIALFCAFPVIALAFVLLNASQKLRRRKAETLYEELKAKKDVQVSK